MLDNSNETLLKEFPKDIKFKFPWRSYQARVLDELDTHLEDKHLHVIAPPGSGKTILGLEVALRLNQPTLIFAPTIAIRNQWVKRFTELFLQTEEVPNWISYDIKKPEFITVSTYQGLFTACTTTDEVVYQKIMEEENENEEHASDLEALDTITSNNKPNTSTKYSKTATAKIINKLRKKGVQTIVVDEAHHLKNAWWKSLDMVKQQLNPTIVGLTATPPYDTTYAEWKRYIDLNGPVDAEISVPELIAEGDLCAHQDYVLISTPTAEENKKLLSYRNKIEHLITDIKRDTDFINILSTLPIFTQPEEKLEWIYANVEQYSALLIFLNAVAVEINPIHLEVIGDAELEIPPLTKTWLEVLLKFYLFSTTDFLQGNETHQENLMHKLKRNGAIERKAITLTSTEKSRKVLSSSLNKLESIHQIASFESTQLGKSLRMVILTDFIRKEYLVSETEYALPINTIGVLPIFEKLRRKQSLDRAIGVLTGSTVIIPKTSLSKFKAICTTNRVESITTKPLPYDANFVQISNSNNLKQVIVSVVTQLFEEGYIRILVGTKSLLGEGWDAPAINALILASFVGSFVQSNQMRGRAIRTWSKNANKTGNIWHLLCTDLGNVNGGADMELLKRRFRGFVGISNKQTLSIENGMDRIAIPNTFLSSSDINEYNQKVWDLAKNREALILKWKEALQTGNILIEEIKVPFPRGNYQKEKSLVLNRTMASLFGFLGSGLMVFAESSLEILIRNFRHIRNFSDVLWSLGILGMIGLLIFGRLIYKSLRLYVNYRDISKDLKNIGIALLDTLCELNQITTNRKELKVIATKTEQGTVYCHLEGGSTFEKSLFIQSLTEIVEEIDNPRYLIIRKNYLLKFKKQQDFHSVPENIGRLKPMAQKLKNNWENTVGNCGLVYTRNLEGRKLLLRSRLTSLATALESKTERVNKWV